MKTLKVLSTSAIVAALLATCGMTAFADDQPAIDQNVGTITLGEGEESGEGEEEPGEEGYATFADYFNDTEENTGFELKFVSATKDGTAINLTVEGTTVLADLGLEDGEYVFEWTVDGEKVAIEVDVADGEVEILGEADAEGESEGEGEEEGEGEGEEEEEEGEEGEKEVDSKADASDDEDEEGEIDDDEDDEDEEKDDDVEYDLLDVVNAAQDAGVNKINVMTLKNFLILNDEYFDSDDYADFIDAVNEVRDLYVAPLAYSIFYKTPAELKESERYEVFDAMTRAERDAIEKDFIKLAKDHGVLLTWDKDAQGYPVVYASMLGKTEDAGTKTSSGTQIAAGAAVKATGALPEESTNSAAAFAGVALALAAAGVVIVARKNRA